MTNPTDRADDRLAAWTSATDRPTPSFERPASQRTGRSHALVSVLVAVALVGVIVATVVVVGGRSTPTETDSPTDLVTSAARAFATAPGIDYRIAIETRSDDGLNQELISTGTIDYTSRRFSGTANAGKGQTMLLFGGPASGAVVIADGQFVKTEAGVWEQVADATSPFDRLLDRAAVSMGLLDALQGARVDPATGTAVCGTETCRTVSLVVPPARFAALMAAIFGESSAVAPPDLAPIAVELQVDPRSGFIRHLETRGTAGTTTTTVVVDVTRLDPPPAIVRPIP